MRLLNVLLGIAAGLTATDIRADDVKFVNGAWERLQQGGADPTPVLHVSSQVRVVLRGNTQGSRITYRLIQRVLATSEQEAERRLAGTVSIVSSPVETSINAQGTLQRSSATLEVFVPLQVKSANLEILRGGDIEVYEFHGDFLARTPRGDIQADNIYGSVSAYTGGGHIRLGKVGGNVDCSTGAGLITVASAAKVNCSTVGGEVAVTQARGPVWLSSGGGNIVVEHASQSVEAHSVQGTIQVGQAGGMVTADAQGGAIRIGSAAGVRAASAAGPVHLIDVSGSLTVSAAIGSILAELMAGAKLQNSSLVARSGDITLMIPSNLALSVMATNQRGGVPQIESDFSGVHMSPWSFAGPPSAEATINGGGPVLMLSGGGMIYLKRVR